MSGERVGPRSLWFARRELTGKPSTSTVSTGSFGLYEYGSQPQLLLEPGNYPGLPWSNWIGCSWKGLYSLSDNFPPLEQSDRLLRPNEKLSKLGLAIVQVSQNQAAVCMDPQNRVFVVADGGFVAVAQTGAYRTLGLVDMVRAMQSITRTDIDLPGLSD